jgi:integrase/recombinase XerD
MLDQHFSLFLKEKQYMQNCSPKTIKYFQCSYNAFRRTTKSNEITKTVLNEFVIKMRESGLSARSCNDYIKGMNSFLKWLYESELIPELHKIKTMKEEKKVLRSFTDEELKRIISWRPKKPTQVRLHVLLLTLIDTGCRIDELLTLTREHLDFDNLLIKVMGKGRKERIVPMSMELRKVLFRYVSRHHYDLVFPTSNGTQLDYRNIWRDTRTLFNELRINPEGFHTFRRTFARQYLKHGGNLFYLMHTMGHTRIETTRIYLDVDTEELQRTHLKTSLLSRLK